jgi:diguanylate cyclase (GGDEF)-like protein
VVGVPYNEGVGTPEPGTAALSLDAPGSANRSVVLRSVAFAAALALAGVAVVALGPVQLGALPSFAAVQASWVFVVDATTGWVLLHQFGSHHRTVYAVLGAAYLMDALLMPVFLLSFPGGLRPGELLLGGSQSSIWVWHAWHLLFAVSALVALLAEKRWVHLAAADAHPRAILVEAVAVSAGVAGAVTLGVTTFAGHLPVLIVPGRADPLTGSFYAVASLVAVLTLGAAAAFWRVGWRDRRTLHLWFAVALTAFSADALANLFATNRYSVGWYFGRAEAMLASSVLLVVFLSQVSRLSRKLAEAADALVAVNEGLVRAMGEKDSLVIDLRRSEEKVRELAFYDDLTDLPNRRLLLDRAAQALAHAERSGHAVGVLFLDVDRFKEINDGLGHDVGDIVLKEVATRLGHCSRRGDTVSRVGGDEFVLLLAEIAHRADAGHVAEKVIEAMEVPVYAGSHVLDVSVSIGIALSPQDERTDFAALLKDADTAMYAAKASGRNQYRFYRDLPLASCRPDTWT